MSNAQSERLFAMSYPITDSEVMYHVSDKKQSSSSNLYIRERYSTKMSHIHDACLSDTKLHVYGGV
jgi:hypothetical protein